MQILPKVLKFSAGGMPVAWVDWQRAVCLYMDNKVLWEAGAEPIMLRGGWNRECGERSTFALSPIIAVNDRSRIWEQGGVFPLTRRRLLARRRHGFGDGRRAGRGRRLLPYLSRQDRKGGTG